MFVNMHAGLPLFYIMTYCSVSTRSTASEEVLAGTNDGERAPPPASDNGHVERMKLTQLDPVEVGHIYKMELEPRRFYQVKTLAVKPPIFTIPDFLSPDEYTSIKSLAESKGLHASRTVYREEVDNTIESTADPYYNTDTFSTLDGDNDGYLGMDETKKALSELVGVPLMADSTFMHFMDDVVDLDSDRELSNVEFRRIPTILTEVAEWVEEHKDDNDLTAEELKRLEAGPARISHQVWMTHEEYDPEQAIRNRLIKLTGLHPDIVATSEELQVVRYLPGGHYHAHHDSTEFRADQPCHHTVALYPTDPEAHLRTDRLCRYMTVLYYLVDTEEGGETAFPAADNETYSMEVVRYLPGGHYHAHHDSTEFRTDQPCHHTVALYPTDPEAHLRTDRLCRYMTVLYYLVDTEEGGETAFPAADNETYSMEETLRENRAIDPIDLTHHCKDAKLYVRPRQGMAVMWYNHHLDANTGWLGNLHDYSLHGGCDVIKGEKWIANNWIDVDKNYDMQMRLHYEKLHKSPTEDPTTDQTDSTGEPKSADNPTPAESGGHQLMADEL